MPQLTQGGALYGLPPSSHPPGRPSPISPKLPPPPAVRGMPAEVELGHWGSPTVISEVDAYPCKHFTSKPLFYLERELGKKIVLCIGWEESSMQLQGGRESEREPGGYDLQIN